ncbi:MAG: hypothetical protein KIT16_08080 [Rhodospirillaceae bacterium]|nr:hypothetical protein [Rhodospirillaceae bacterium]
MKTTTWIVYTAAFFLIPAALGLAGAYAAGVTGALTGLTLGFVGTFAGIGWSLRR